MSTVSNPWLRVTSRNGSYVLDEDQKHVQAHNHRVRAKSHLQIIESSIPEPFIGNALSARVILLGLNPGHSPADAHDYARPEFRDAMFNNLRQIPQPYPFYPLNPAFAGTGTGLWWRPRLERLLLDTELPVEEFSERIMVIEWFPYHSKNFVPPKEPMPSQKFSFWLAKKMMMEQRLVIRMRSKTLWERADPQFGWIPALSNPQCGYISPGNAKSAYQKIVKAMTGQ